MVKKNSLFWLIIGLIFISILSLVYYTANSGIKDASELGRRVSRELFKVNSYQYAMSMNLSTLLDEESFSLMNNSGKVDYKNERSYNLITMTNKSVETILIGDSLYAKEQTEDKWAKQGVIANIWESGYDQLSAQRLILLNSSNMDIQENQGGWVLKLRPDKSIVMNQLRRKGVGLETLKEEELYDYRITYLIDKNYHITEIETWMQLEMNIQGLVTPMNLASKIRFYNYNKKLNIDKPVSI